MQRSKILPRETIIHVDDEHPGCCNEQCSFFTRIEERKRRHGHCALFDSNTGRMFIRNEEGHITAIYPKRCEKCLVTFGDGSETTDSFKEFATEEDILHRMAVAAGSIADLCDILECDSLRLENITTIEGHAREILAEIKKVRHSP